MIALEVWGDFACFSRPEMKVERFSYPAITPSAARGVIEAIYWKPEFQWVIDRIEILSYPQWIGLRRNEVKDKAPGEQVILGWKSGKAEIEPQWADADQSWVGTDQKGRTQRQTMALKNPHYRIFAHPEPWGSGSGQVVKYEAQFRRRAERGQCIYQPYLGCREFPAYFRVAHEGDLPRPVSIDANWGRILYDVFSHREPGSPYSAPEIQTYVCVVRSGVIDVPHYRKLGARGR